MLITKKIISISCFKQPILMFFYVIPAVFTYVRYAHKCEYYYC